MIARLISHFQWRTFPLIGVLAASLGLNVVQRAAIQKLESSLDAANSLPQLRDGMAVSALAARDLSGHDVLLGFDDRVSTVFYVFGPSCIWCERNLVSINQLASRPDGRFRFIGITTASRKDVTTYLGTRKVAFPVYADVSPRSAREYRLGITPQTIVVGKGGEVLKVWSGAFTGSVKPEVEAFFSIQLPELRWAPTDPVRLQAPGKRPEAACHSLGIIGSTRSWRALPCGIQGRGDCF